MENYLRRGVRGVRHRVGTQLNRAAVSRAHDALYLSDAWTEATWLGAQALKNPLDLWVYQEIIVETRPELVVETGTYRGGSAFFLASICDLLGTGEVVSIDVEQVRDDYPAHPRITYLGGRSSTDPDVVADVQARAEGKPTLVILDSDHSQAHVEAELAVYADLVRVGGYLIVADYVFTQPGIELDGRRVAEGTAAGLVLWEVDGPVRVVGASSNAALRRALCA